MNSAQHKTAPVRTKSRIADHAEPARPESLRAIAPSAHPAEVLQRVMDTQLSSLRRSDVVVLQRTIGNRAVGAGGVPETGHPYRDFSFVPVTYSTKE